MSASPHVLLPWTVRRTRLPLLSLRCPDCRSSSATTGSGRFRVNASAKLLDVWLLVRCVTCDRTTKLTVHERAPVGSLDPAALHGYHTNDPALVASVLLNPHFTTRGRHTLDWTNAWQLDVPASPPDDVWPLHGTVRFEDPIPIRADRLLAQGLGLTRSAVHRRVKTGIPLHRPQWTDFAFTVLAVAQPLPG